MTTNQWQPIETAPKDGSEIVVWDGLQMQIVSWSCTSVYGRKGWVFGECQGEYNSRQEIESPTRWQPKPNEPEE